MSFLINNNGRFLMVGEAVPYTIEPICFEALEAGSTVYIQSVGNAPELTVTYSTDGVDWNTYTIDQYNPEVITLANIGDKVYFQGSNYRWATGTGNYNRFVMTGSIKGSGDLYALISKGRTYISTETHVFCNLFRECESLTECEIYSTMKLEDDGKVSNHTYDRLFFGTGFETYTWTTNMCVREDNEFQTWFQKSSIKTLKINATVEYTDFTQGATVRLFSSYYTFQNTGLTTLIIETPENITVPSQYVIHTSSNMPSTLKDIYITNEDVYDWWSVEYYYQLEERGITLHLGLPTEGE